MGTKLPVDNHYVEKSPAQTWWERNYILNWKILIAATREYILHSEKLSTVYSNTGHE